MSGSFLHNVRTAPIVWRLRFACYRLAEYKGSLAFFAMLGLPILTLGIIVLFAYANRPHIDLTRIDPAHQRAVDLRCLAENIYFEARGEPLEGQYAVAEVTLNRRASPHFPDTICGVVHDTRWDRIRRRPVAHFSWTELEDRPEPRGPAWQKAMAVATAAYDEANVPVVPKALFYHANTIYPSWAGTKRVVAKVGNHVFYR